MFMYKYFMNGLLMLIKACVCIGHLCPLLRLLLWFVCANGHELVCFIGDMFLNKCTIIIVLLSQLL